MCQPYSWIEGLLSTNLNDLSGAPGIGIHWGILLIVFFSNIAWEFAIQCPDKDPFECTVAALNGERKLKKGKKVTVHSLDGGDNSAQVTDGMQCKIVEKIDQIHYTVTFTNLAKPQVLHRSNLRKVGQVSRECHSCICGEESGFVYNRYRCM